MKLRSLLMALGFLTALSFASDAAAQGYKGYPASNCVRVSGAAIFLNTGAVENDSTTEALNIDCPMLNARRTNGRITAQVQIRDVSGTDGIRCNMVAAFTQGPTVFTRSTPVSTTAANINTNWVPLVFSSLSTPENYDYYMTCRIPPKTANGRSGIAQYEAFES